MLKKFVLQPGFVRDGTDYAAGGGWWDGQWVRFHVQSPQSIGGFQHIATVNSATYAGTCRSLFSWTALDGTPLVAVGTHTNYYVLANNILNDATPAGLPVVGDTGILGGGYGTGNYGSGPWGGANIGVIPQDELLGRVWTQGNWGQDLFVCDKDIPNGLYYWTYSNPQTNKLVPLNTIASAGCPYVARCVFVTPDRHAVACGSSQQGAPQQDLMNVSWSDIENIGDWTRTDINEAGSYPLAIGSEIVSARPTRQENLIWTNRALYSMRYVGAPYIFGFTLVSDGISIAGINTTVDNGTVVFWMGLGEFYAYSGAVQVLPCPIRDFVFNGMTPSYAGKFFAGLNRRFAEIWFFYVSKAPGATEIDSYCLYNWVDNVWSFGQIVRTAWNDPSILQYPIAAGDADASGLLYEHEFGASADGQNLVSYIESADLDISDGDRFTFCRKVMPDIHFMSNIANPSPAPSATVTVNFKPGPEMAPSKTVSAVYAQAGGMIYVRGRGRAATFRITSVAQGVTWRVGNMRADIQPDGRR